MRLGSKYKTSQGRIFECVFRSPEDVNTKVAILRWTDTYGKVYDHCAYQMEWKYFEEYVEPRREFFNAYKFDKGETYYNGPFMDRHQADIDDRSHQGVRYGILELIHHSDTKVESIFHLTKKE